MSPPPSGAALGDWRLGEVPRLCEAEGEAEGATRKRFAAAAEGRCSLRVRAHWGRLQRRDQCPVQRGVAWASPPPLHAVLGGQRLGEVGCDGGAGRRG